MLARPFARVALVLVVLGPIACSAINPKYRDSGPSRARANVPAGVFAPGRWSAEMAGTPPSDRGATVPIGGVVTFEVDVSPVRDSAQMVFLVPRYRPAPGGDVDAPSPRSDVLRPRPAGRSNGVTRDVVRVMPSDVWIDEGAVSFHLPSAMGWQHVRCRLARNADSFIWEGPCVAGDGLTAVRLMLAVPQVATKAGG